MKVQEVLEIIQCQENVFYSQLLDLLSQCNKTAITVNHFQLLKVTKTNQAGKTSVKSFGANLEKLKLKEKNC